MGCSNDRGAMMPEFLPSFCPYQNPDTQRSVVPLWNTRQSQLPCKTLERCPSAVRLHLLASLPRASTTSRGRRSTRRSTNDGRGTRPPTHGMSEHSSFDECSPRGRRAGRCAARARARRADSPGTRSVTDSTYRPDAFAPYEPSGAPPRATLDVGFPLHRRGFSARVRLDERG